MDQSWYLAPPSAKTSLVYADRNDSTRAQGSTITRNGLRTRIRSSFAKTAGRTV
ncbi:hypothetical protein RKD42_005369 [Streptomyces ambofaciens]